MSICIPNKEWTQAHVEMPPFHQVATHSTSLSHRPSKSLHEEMDFTWPNGEQLLHSSLKKLRNSFRSSEIFRTLAAQSDFNGFRCYRRVPERSWKARNMIKTSRQPMSHPPVSAITNDPFWQDNIQRLGPPWQHLILTWQKNTFLVLKCFEWFWVMPEKRGGSSLISQLNYIMLLISNLRLILRFNLNLEK